MESPILVTSAAGRVGAVGRTATELLLKQGRAVRAMVRKDDQRGEALREMGVRNNSTRHIKQLDCPKFAKQLSTGKTQSREWKRSSSTGLRPPR